MFPHTEQFSNNSKYSALPNKQAKEVDWGNTASPLLFLWVIPGFTK